MVGPPSNPPANTASAAPTPAASPALAATPAPPAITPVPPAQTPGSKTAKRWWPIALAVVIGLVLIVLLARWAFERATSSITEDAFIEAHIVNIAPQTVSGHLVRYMVEENKRIEKGQVLAEIDPIPYRDQVELAHSKVDEAEVELRRQQAGLARLKLEVPIQIEISRRSLAAAQATRLEPRNP